MSILDRIFIEEIDSVELAETVRRSIEELRTIHPEAGELMALISEGLTLGDIAGFGDQHKEALFQLGCRLMLCNEIEQAETIFVMLSLLDPLEARAHYGAGVAMKARGKLPGAAQFFMQFLALDATNPVGYLRLGECLVAAGEIEEARSAFAAAEALASTGHGSKAQKNEAADQIRLLSDNILRH